MITLILVRHGETDWNVAGRLAGFSDGAVLTKEGQRQAELLAIKLRNLKIDIIYSSKLKRAKQTARIISKTINKRVIYKEFLNERSWGIYEGTDHKKIFENVEKMLTQRRLKYKPKGGESLIEFEKRLQRGLRKIMENNDEQNILIVSHGGVIKTLIPILKKAPLEEAYNLKVSNASLTIFNINESKVEIKLINDVSHLA